MSQQTVQAVIGKAITDTPFRHSLFADPDSALAGYELTEEEIDALRAIDFETMECCAQVLDDRIAKAGMFRRRQGKAGLRPAVSAKAGVQGETSREPHDKSAVDNRSTADS